MLHRFPLGIVVSSFLLCHAQAAIPVVDTSDSPFAALRSVGVDEVQWTSGYWADRANVCRDRSIPAMWEIMRGTKYKPFLQHFLIAAGQAEGDYHGAAWNDGDFYKWIEAATVASALEPDSQMQEAVARSIKAIVAAQREDGYLHTPVLIRRRNGDLSAKPLSDRHDFEVYNMGHLMTAGCMHARATGDQMLLQASERAAQFLERAFAEPTPEIARNSVCPSHYMGVLELYRTTKDRRYLQLAEKLLAMRDLVQEGSDDNQDRLPFVQQREAVGHAVRANYLCAGAADLYLETGDRQLRAPLEAIWQNVVQKKLYVTGACGALYDGASPDGSPNQTQIARVHQSYGRNYQLPNTTAHNETCAAIGAVMWNWRMFLATPDAKYIDWLELAMHNAVMSGVSLEGSEYFYVNPLRNVDPLPTDLRWSRTRVPFIVSYCCPPNVVRTLAELGGYAYSKSEGALWVNLYAGNELNTVLDGAKLRLSQETLYPWDGTIRITIDECGDKPFSLRLRQPGWSERGTVAVNGNQLSGLTTEAGYYDVHRQWQTGDTVEIQFNMPVVFLESHPLVEETRNQVAVKRGPIVYCLESVDLPSDVQLCDVAIDPSDSFTAEYDKELLGGVVRLTGRLVHRHGNEWSRLYRPADVSEGTSFHAALVPYYAWGNRGESEMSVWIPRQ